MKFRMVDRILAYEWYRSIRGIKAVSFEEYRLRPAIDVQPQLPESLLLQSLIELGNWLLILSSDFTRSSQLASLDRVELHGALRPGEQLLIDVTLTHHDDRTANFTGRGRTAGARASICGDVPNTGNRHAERTREASGLGLQSQILREYAQNDNVGYTNVVRRFGANSHAPAGRDIITVTAWQASLQPLSRYFSPDDLRVLFSEIHRPEEAS